MVQGKVTPNHIFFTLGTPSWCPFLFHIGYTLLVSLSFSHLFHNHFKSPLVIFFQGSPLLTFLGVKIKYAYFQTTFGLPNLTKHLDNPALYQAKHNQPINQQPIHYNNQTKLINHNHNYKNTFKKNIIL